ncbi:MAG: diguanylate cyclase [Deltaproteobacteria bacterium]|nr:diguanylate cyclase [Deltaproteobacteria bacterium]
MAGQTTVSDPYTRQIESFMEAILGIALLVAVNYFWFPDDPGFLKVSPHPFLFITILIASRYGTFDGFMTGITCAFIYAMYLFAGKDLNTVVQTFEWSQFIPAYLFVIMGLLLGEIREISNREVMAMRTDVRSMKARMNEVSREYEMVSQVKDELQQRILSAEDPLEEFYESARKLSTLHPDEAYPAVMELVEKFTGAEKFGLYVAESSDEGVAGTTGSQVYTLRLMKGWSTPDEFRTRLTEEDPALARAIDTRDVVTIKDAGASDSQILACAPMLDPVDDTILGFIVIHRIPFVRLTRMTISHLHTIAGWAGKTISDSTRFDSAMDARVDDEVTGLFNYSFMSKRLADEAQRVKRYGGKCSYLLIRIQELETLSAEDRQYLMREMGSMLRSLLRNVDMIGVHRLPGVFGLILPETSPAQTVVVTARINEAFRQKFGGLGSRFTHLGLKMGVAGTAQEEEKTDSEIIAEAERFQLT